MPQHPLSVGILSKGDPSDIRTWSGVPYFITRELRRRFQRVVYLPAAPPRYAEGLRKLNQLSRRCLRRGFVPWATPAHGRHYARQIATALQQQPVDVLLAITVDHQLAYLDTPVPIVHHSDTTFARIADYYPEFSGLWGWSRRQAHRMTGAAIRRATASVFPSHWAAESAIRDYGAAPDRIHVVPYGANLEDPPTDEIVLASNRRRHCQLLFVGAAWDRKGGNLAFATMQSLRQRGIDARLAVIGVEPPSYLDRTHLVHYGFLNKQKPDQSALYRQLWLESSFLCMPSRAETFGAVFAEAAAFGLPVIGSQTGGIPSAVSHHETGILHPLNASSEDLAADVAAIWNDAERYQQMVQACRRRFETVLNWSVWADQVSPLLLAAARQTTAARVSAQA